MRLLIAEDERELAKALKTIFEKHNYSVDTVFDGQAALDYALTDNYDGVVLDVFVYPAIRRKRFQRTMTRRSLCRFGTGKSYWMSMALPGS